MESEDDWPEVVEKIIKARTKWASITSILGWKGANTQLSGIFFKAVVQAVFLFGLETWVMTPRTGPAL